MSIVCRQTAELHELRKLYRGFALKDRVELTFFKTACEAIIERYPSVRTIPLGESHQKAHKRKNAAAEIALQRRRHIVILM